MKILPLLDRIDQSTEGMKVAHPSVSPLLLHVQLCLPLYVEGRLRFLFEDGLHLLLNSWDPQHQQTGHPIGYPFSHLIGYFSPSLSLSLHAYPTAIWRSLGNAHSSVSIVSQNLEQCSAVAGESSWSLASQVLFHFSQRTSLSHSHIPHNNRKPWD